MKPKIISTRFGSITIEGENYENDVLIRLGGEVKKRKKKLSKAIYGTSHVISLDEAQYIFEEGAERLIIGTGQTGLVELSDEAADYFRKMNVRCRCYQHQRRFVSGINRTVKSLLCSMLPVRLPEFLED